MQTSPAFQPALVLKEVLPAPAEVPSPALTCCFSEIALPRLRSALWSRESESCMTVRATPV